MSETTEPDPDPDAMDKEEFCEWMSHVVGETVIIENAEMDDVADWLREIADHMDVCDDVETAINTSFGTKEAETDGV